MRPRASPPPLRGLPLHSSLPCLPPLPTRRPHPLARSLALFFSRARTRSTTPTEGGETVFPNAADKSTGPEWSKCAQQGLAVKAYKGDALMFYSLKPDGSTDTASLHGSCPTLQGDKWSATKWIHVGPVGG